MDHDDDILLNPAEQLRFFGNVSRMWIWRRGQGDPEFPEAVQFSPGGPKYRWRGECVRYAERHRCKALPAVDADGTEEGGEAIPT